MERELLIEKNDSTILFKSNDKSCVNIKNNKDIVISLDKKAHGIILEEIMDYLSSSKRFPLDISLEQLEFSILPEDVKDVVIECGSYQQEE